MMTILDYYWPVLVIALLIGIVSGVACFSRATVKAGE